MAHRHLLAVDRVGRVVGGHALDQVGDDLVAAEIEIHPFVRTAPFRAAEEFAVELARAGKVGDGEGKVKRGQGCHAILLRVFALPLCGGRGRLVCHRP